MRPRVLAFTVSVHCVGACLLTIMTLATAKRGILFLRALTTSTLGDFGVFPALMRAACAQVWLVPTSVRALRTLGRATAAWRGGGAAQEAACGAAKSRFLRF